RCHLSRSSRPLRPPAPSLFPYTTLFRSVLVLITVLFSACATMFTPRTQHASAAATTIPNMPMLKWGIESCGAGSLATVLQHYGRSEEHTSELQSRGHLVCRLLLEKKKKK